MSQTTAPFALLDVALLASGTTAPYALGDVLLATPAGKARVVVADLPWDEAHLSILEGADPPAVNGDVIEHDAVTSPGGFSVTVNPDGTFFFGANDDGSTQTFDYRLWRRETGAWTTTATVTVNEPSDIPVLSFPGVIDITATSARPQVTVTY